MDSSEDANKKTRGRESTNAALNPHLGDSLRGKFSGIIFKKIHGEKRSVCAPHSPARPLHKESRETFIVESLLSSNRGRIFTNIPLNAIHCC